jgi:hypothetical protein
MSVVGIQVGLFALPFVIAAFILAWSIAVYSVGDQLRVWFRRDKDPWKSGPISRKAQFGWTALGTVVTLFIFFVPFFGFIFCTILFLAGLGSLYTPATQRSPAPSARTAQPAGGRWVPRTLGP